MLRTVAPIPFGWSLRAAARRRVLLFGTMTAVFVFVLFWGEAGRALGYQLSWSAPILVDHQGPFEQTGRVGGFACVGTAVCFAGGAEHALVSSDPFSGPSAHWSILDITNESDVAFSCPSSTLCVGVDTADQSVTTTDPLDGARAKWSYETIDSGVNTVPEDVSCPSTTLCVAVDSNAQILTTTDPADGATAVWTKASAPNDGVISEVSCPSVDLCVAIENSGRVFTSVDPADGSSATWATTTGMQASSIACPSTALCVAIGPPDTVYTTTDPADGSTAVWHQKALAVPTSLETVACTNAPVCFVGDSNGNMFTTSDPADGATATWTSANVDGTAPQNELYCESGGCIGGDQDGRILTNADVASNSWSIELVDGLDPFLAVSCAPGGVCAAINRAGNVASSMNPTSGAWAVKSVAPSNNYLYGIACPSDALCIAVGSGGNIITTKDPADGTGATWSTLQIPSVGYFSAVACLSDEMCLAADGSGSVYVSTDPTARVAAAWTREATGLAYVGSISCPAIDLCVAAGGGTLPPSPAGADVAFSTDPADDSNARWNTDYADSTQRIESVACPSTSLCIAGAQNGDELATTDPTGGPNRIWSTLFNANLNGESCPSADFCAVAEDHEILTSQTPGSGGWDGTIVDAEPQSLAGISCQSVTLCVAVDGVGQITVGTADPSSIIVSLAGAGAGTVTGPGLSCPTACAQSYPADTPVTLTATPTGGSTFAGWAGACSGEGKCTVTTGALQYVTANFNLAPVSSTSTQLSCSYSPLSFGDTCTASVSATGTDNPPPTGTVQFTSTGAGRFSGKPTASCTLSSAAGLLGATTECAVTYSLPPTTPATVIASYSGDALHHPSNTETNPLANLGPLGRIISHVAVSPHAFPGTSQHRRHKTPAIRVTMAAPAAITITAERFVPRAGKADRDHRCHGVNSRCGRWVQVHQSVTVTVPVGASTFRLPAQLYHRLQKPGYYRLIATPTVAASSGDPATTTFRVT